VKPPNIVDEKQFFSFYTPVHPTHQVYIEQEILLLDAARDACVDSYSKYWNKAAAFPLCTDTALAV
jgi:hypothetical protein